MKSFEDMAFSSKTNSEQFGSNASAEKCLPDHSNRRDRATFLPLDTIDITWGPIKIGIYARYLERWLQYFSLSQFLFVSGERLIFDPA